MPWVNPRAIARCQSAAAPQVSAINRFLARLRSIEVRAGRRLLVFAAAATALAPACAGAATQETLQGDVGDA